MLVCEDLEDLKPKLRPAIHWKFTVNSLSRPQIGQGGGSGIPQGGANCVNQVGGVSDMAPTG